LVSTYREDNLSGIENSWTVSMAGNDSQSESSTHSVSQNAADLWNFEVGHGWPLARGTLNLALGYEHFEHKDSGENEDGPRFLVQWRSKL